jgi:transcriptional regulator with XRE-family HTH domain
MKFYERLKAKREECNLTQAELAKASGITTRTIQNYEAGKFYPSTENARKLSVVLNCTLNDLLAEEETFIAEASSKGGAKAANDVRSLIEEISALFAGGSLPEEDKDALMAALNEAYWQSKKINKKYSSKKDNRSTKIKNNS